MPQTFYRMMQHYGPVSVKSRVLTKLMIIDQAGLQHETSFDLSYTALCGTPNISKNNDPFVSSGTLYWANSKL